MKGKINEIDFNCNAEKIFGFDMNKKYQPVSDIQLNFLLLLFNIFFSCNETAFYDVNRYKNFHK